MSHLPEPRRFSEASVPDPLLALTLAAAADASGRGSAALALQQAIAGSLARGDDRSVMQSLAQVPDARAYRVLTDALAGSIDTPKSSGGEILARAFALPLVLVAGSAQSARIPGRLADSGAIQALFERKNALGPTRNFGLSNALCSLEALESLRPLAIFGAVRSVDPGSIADALPPQDIAVAGSHEQAYLRFLVGAGIGPADAPGFTEVAAHIGSWGLDCAKLLAAQLAVPGVQLLVLPRPPKDLIRAPHAGRFAQLEVAFNLFASNGVRRFRMAVGDPMVVVSAHEGGEVRISMSSPFAEELADGFRWPLHPMDDLDEVERLVLGLFADMRVRDVCVIARLLPSMRDNGVPFHPRYQECDALAAAKARH